MHLPSAPTAVPTQARSCGRGAAGERRRALPAVHPCTPHQDQIHSVYLSVLPIAVHPPARAQQRKTHKFADREKLPRHGQAHAGDDEGFCLAMRSAACGNVRLSCRPAACKAWQCHCSWTKHQQQQQQPMLPQLASASGRRWQRPRRWPQRASCNPQTATVGRQRLRAARLCRVLAEHQRSAQQVRALWLRSLQQLLQLHGHSYCCQRCHLHQGPLCVPPTGAATAPHAPAGQPVQQCVLLVLARARHGALPAVLGSMQVPSACLPIRQLKGQPMWCWALQQCR